MWVKAAREGVAGVACGQGRRAARHHVVLAAPLTAAEPSRLGRFT